MKKKLKQIKEYIIPILSFLLAIGSFFTGRWVENKELELKRDELIAEQANFELEIARLKSEHQKELQFKYVDLLTQNLSEENLFKADIIIHLIEDPEVRIKFANLTQKILDKKGLNPETSKNFKSSFANTSYEARQQIEDENEKLSQAIIKKSKLNPFRDTTSDSTLLEKIDKKEHEKIESRYNVYHGFLNLLSEIRNQTVVTKEQSKKYVNLHVEILNKYANENLKEIMNDLFEARKDNYIGPLTKSLIDRTSEILQDELSKTLWCKEGYYIKWKNLKCSVTDLSTKERKVVVRLVDLDSGEVLRDQLSLKEGEDEKIAALNISIKLVKIDKAGKNIFKQAGYFKFTDFN